MTVITTSTPTDTVTRIRPDRVLGTDISGANSVDDALKIAGLDWGITTVDGSDGMSVVVDGQEKSLFMPDRKLLVRSDRPIILGAVGNGYRPVPNADAFAVADAAREMGAAFVHAGESDYGRRTFLTMSLPEATVMIGGHDAVAFGLRFTTDHAGTGAIVGEAIVERLVCTNGQRLSGWVNRWKVRHTITASDRLDLAADLVRGTIRYAQQYKELGDRLVAAPMTFDQFGRYIDAIWEKPNDDRKSAVSRWESRRQQLMGLYRTWNMCQDGGNSAWAAFATVNEYDQWLRPARSPESRARRQMSEAAQKFNDGALATLNDLVAA